MKMARQEAVGGQYCKVVWRLTSLKVSTKGIMATGEIVDVDGKLSTIIIIS